MRIGPGMILGGRYVLLSRIATGGMGEVWRARDRVGGKLVAAKVLREELCGQEHFLARLRTEARNAMRLVHPNIAAVLDHGEDGGAGWIVMELVRGNSLADLLEGGQTLPPSLLLPVLYQTSLALAKAHEAGIVHRDIKPANILLTPDNQVKLTDFGISLAADQAPLTAVGMVMGTAQYLPPEQAVGNTATALGDLYALGVIAYEALAGHRPFTGASQVDIAFAHVNNAVPALPMEIPLILRTLVFSLLKKDPAERPTDALKLAQCLVVVGEKLGVQLPGKEKVNLVSSPSLPAPAPVRSKASTRVCKPVSLPTQTPIPAASAATETKTTLAPSPVGKKAELPPVPPNFSPPPPPKTTVSPTAPTPLQEDPRTKNITVNEATGPGQVTRRSRKMGKIPPVETPSNSFSKKLTLNQNLRELFMRLRTNKRFSLKNGQFHELCNSVGQSAIRAANFLKNRLFIKGSGTLPRHRGILSHIEMAKDVTLNVTVFVLIAIATLALTRSCTTYLGVVGFPFALQALSVRPSILADQETKT